MKNFNIKLVSNVQVSDVCMSDYPDFCDAFVESADYDGEEMTEKELDYLMDNFSDYCHESYHESLH